MKIGLLGIGSETLLADLDTNGIKYVHQRPPLGTVMMGSETIEIVKDAVPWTALATVLVTWLRVRVSRKFILTQQDNTVIHAEGMGVDEIAKLLPHCRELSAIETKKTDKQSRNKEGAR